MTNIFKLSFSKKSKQNALNLNVTRPNQVKYGDRSLRVLSPKIWNNLPSHINSTVRKVKSNSLYNVEMIIVFQHQNKFSLSMLNQRRNLKLEQR